MDFQDSVLVLGFSEELNKLLLQLYLENRKEIRQILSNLSPNLPHYHNLEWRLDVQVWIIMLSGYSETVLDSWINLWSSDSEWLCLQLASRALRHQVKPTVTLKLQLEDSGKHRAHVLQTDPATLQHLIQEMERALAELKSNHCRRILRNIK